MLNYLLKIKDPKIIFFFYIVFLTTLNYIFCYLYTLPEYRQILIDENNNYILTKIAFGFGEVIENIYNGKGASVYWFGDIELKSGRRLFVPYYLMFISEYITSNFYFIHLIKNLLLSTLLFFSIFLLKNKKSSLFIFLSIFIIFYIPHNSFTILGTENEEGVLIYLILILFFLSISEIQNKSIIISIVLTLIFFLKGSMFFLVSMYSFFYFFYEKKQKHRYIVIVCLLAANLLWGYNSYQKNGFFAIGAKGSSMNAINLSTVTHDMFNETYPQIRPDIHLDNIGKFLKEKKISDEKEVVNILMEKSMNYIFSQPQEYILGVLKKIYVLNFSPFKDAQMPKGISGSDYIENIRNNKKNLNPEIINPIRFSNFPNKIIFNISLILLIISFFSYKKNSVLLNKINLYYILIVLTYLAPYMFAWIYPRHAVPIYILAHFYCIFYFIENNKKVRKFFSA